MIIGEHHMSHVFISYARKDKAKVEEFVKALRVENFIVWQDVNDIEGGEKWESAILVAIEKCEAFALFWSAEAVSRPWVHTEIDNALEHGKKIIPIMLDDTPLREDLAELQFVKDAKTLIKTLKPIAAQIEWEENKFFNINTPLGEQTTEDVFFDGELYRSSLLVKTLFSKAVLFAKPETVVAKVTRIQLVIQCTGETASIIPIVFRDIQTEYDTYPKRKEPLVAVHITPTMLGKDRDGKDIYVLDNNIVEHFTTIHRTAMRAISLIKGETSHRKIFQVFQKSLMEIAFLMGREFSRWDEFQLYKWTGEQYAHMINLDVDVPGR